MAEGEDALRPRRARIAIVGATAVAAVLRLASITEQDLSHFDEGVYAIAAMGIRYPGQEFFAPPLFPNLLRLVAAVAGPSDWALYVFSALLGVLTVPLVAAFTWRCFGPSAAAAAAWLAAVSGWHIAFSRAVLTDVLYANLFQLSLLAAIELLKCGPCAVRKRWGITVLLALSLAGATYTKYHFPVLVLGITLGSMCVLVVRRGERTLLVRQFWFVVAASVVGLLAYLPWLFHVNATVGYSALVAHHHGYFEGVAGWASNARDYVGFSAAFATHTEAITAGAVVIGLRLLGLMPAAPLALVAAVAAAIGGAQWLTGDMLYPMCALLFLGWASARWPVARVMLAVTLLLLILITPCYRPYARLFLPAVQLAWPVVGAMLSELPRDGRPLVGVILMAAAGLWLLRTEIALPSCPGDGLPASHDGVEQAVRRLVKSGEVIHVYARPCIVFYAMQHTRVVLEGNPANLVRAFQQGSPVLFDVALTLDNPRGARSLSELIEQQPRFSRVSYCPAKVTLLDDYRALSTRRGRSWPYRLVTVRKEPKR